MYTYLKPPTAGPRLLVLDSSSIRGIFTLQVLDMLELVISLLYPIYDEFDLVLGSSTGMSTNLNGRPALINSRRFHCLNNVSSKKYL